MKRLFFLQKTTAPDWGVFQKSIFWLWNAAALVAGGLGVGVLSLLFAAVVVPRSVMFLSYFQNPLIAFLNLAPVVLLAVFLYCLLGRVWAAYGLTALVTLGFTMASWFKLQFRNDPLLFEDLLLIKEAGNMAGKYQLFVNKPMLAALAVALVGLLLLFFLARGRAKPWPRIGGVALVLLAALPLKNLYMSDDIYHNQTANNDLINRWSATQVYTSKGFVYPFLYSVNSAFDTPPEGYDQKRAQAILSAYQSAHIPEDQKVSVITLMLESYADFTDFHIPGLSDKVYADFHALEAESYTGNLITNIFAGGTVDSERCYLTGFSSLGSFRTVTNSYPWYFKNQGYTVTGAHPCYQWFYNRENINVNLGFDDYKFVENYFSPMTDGNVGFDDMFFPALLKLWETNKTTGKPYFAYNLTYQGHGPYNDDQTWWGDDYVTGGDYTEAERNILNNYFGSIYNTNQNLVDFFHYYREETEPVILVAFGDHMPWLGDGNSVYQALGINLDFSTEEGFYNYYSTRYLIWANDAAKRVLDKEFTGQGPDISPNFLMSEVFRQAGWTGTAFTQATQQVMDRVPVMNTPTGLYVENGTLTDTLSPEGKALTEDYNMVQYYWRKHFTDE